jgi:hypothetical protein
MLRFLARRMPDMMQGYTNHQINKNFLFTSHPESKSLKD